MFNLNYSILSHLIKQNGMLSYVTWDHYGVILESIWDYSGILLPWFRDIFSILLQQFWDHVGVIFPSAGYNYNKTGCLVVINIIIIRAPNHDHGYKTAQSKICFDHRPIFTLKIPYNK